MKKLIAKIVLTAMMVTPLGAMFPLVAGATVAPNWDATGTYVINMNYCNPGCADYPHDMNLTQDGLGNLTGNGGSPAGVNTYTWVVTSGSVSGDTIDFYADYTATPDAVTPFQTTLHVIGTIAPGGIMSGTWSDNYNDGDRSGTWTTASGTATHIYVTTNAATGISATDAMLNGTNGSSTGVGHSFWASLSTFDTSVPVLPAGVYSTVDLGAIGANTPFSALLSSISGLGPITPSTTYYFAAWVNVDGTWYPGEVLNFTTSAAEVPGVGGEIGGDVVGANGVLAVDSVTVTDSSGTADGTFANGWKYVFHITTPNNEPNLAMKFADWLSGANVLPVASNMRISSAQASSPATVLLTAANTYSTPPLVMVSDLNPVMDGRQVDVMVEVSIPVGTVAGSYTTTYGIQTTP